MKFKKIFAVAALIGVCAGLGGCNKENASDTKESQANTTLKWYFPGDTQPDQARVWEEINKEAKEKLGVTLDINMIDRGSYNDKMTMMLASGNDFDICFTSNWTNNFIQGASKGAYLAIDDLLLKTEKLKNSVPDYVWNGAKYNNKIYGVPNYQIMYSQCAAVVPKALAEKYNLTAENKSKPEDFEPFLKQIKENEPQLYCTQPLYAPTDYETISDSGIAILKDSKDYKVCQYYLTDEYKNFIKLRREWFKKGYYRPDILTVTDDRNDRMALKYGLISSTYKPGGEAEMKTLYKTDMLSIPYSEPYVNSNSGQGSIMSIARTSKAPEKALAFLEMLNTDKEFYNKFIYGIENEHYTKDSDDIVTVKPDTKYTMASQWMFGNQFNAYYQMNQTVGSWEETDKVNRESKVSPLSGFVINIDSIKTQIAQCSAVKEEYKHIELGTQDVDDIYKEMMDKMKKAGYDEILKEVQKQVDEWSKNKK